MEQAGRKDPISEFAMKRHGMWAKLSLMAVCLTSAVSLTGCQTNIGGQTLPSAYYLRDDVQFFPAGPEFLLPNQVQAIESYNAQRAGCGRSQRVVASERHLRRVLPRRS